MPEQSDAQKRGAQSYEKGYFFEDRVAEAYKLLGYEVEHGRLFGGRQVDLFLDLKLADLRVLRAVECKAGQVTVDDLDKFLSKLRLVQHEYPSALGTLVAGLSFTDSVRSHATQIGVQLTLYADLSAQILDGPSYAQALIREIEHNERYRPQLFVESLIGLESTGEGRKAFEVIEQWLHDGSWKQLTLLGDVGTGKSFLCRMTALRLARQYLRQPLQAPLPILVDLRNADREFSIEGLILTHFASHGLSRATFDVFDFLLSEGRIVLLLDGFDEMASKVTPTITTRNFHELTRCVKRNSKVLLTCRTHYFKSRTEEEEVVLGGTGSHSRDAARDLYWDLISRSGFKIAYLRPFSMVQIEAYIHKACPDREAAVLAKINCVYNLAELSHRPLLLEMIVKSIDRLTSSEVSSARLYEIFTDAWVHRDIWRDVIRPEDKLNFLTALARSLWDQEKTTIDYRKLQDYVGTALSALIDQPHKLIELDGEIRTAGFLIRDDRGNYGFAHSSYAEYFLARDLAKQVSVLGAVGLSLRRLTNEVIDFLLCLVDKAKLEDMLTMTLKAAYCPLVSENALSVLYRLRYNLVVEEKGRVGDGDDLKIEMPSDVQLQGSKLAQLNLEGAILHSARLEGADLTQCIFRNADLHGSCLENAIVGKADFQNAQLVSVNASGATFTEVNLQGADLSRSNFNSANLSGSMLTVQKSYGAIAVDADVTSATFPSSSGENVFSSLRKTEQLNGDMGRVLIEVFKLVRRYAGKNGTRDPEDIASDVVLYLLSNSNELSRLYESPSELQKFVRTLAWRRIATVARRDFMEGEEVLPDDTEADTPERREQLIDNWPWQDDEIEEQEEIEPLLLGVENDSEQNAELLEILGNRLSPDALQMLIARYVEEEAVEKIAGRMRLSSVQVVRQLNKARELARRALRPLR